MSIQKKSCSYVCSNLHARAWDCEEENSDWLKVTGGAPNCRRRWLCRLTTWSENASSIITKMKIQNEYLQFKQPTALCDIGRTQHSSNVDDERDDCGSDHAWGFREGNLKLSWIHFGLHFLTRTAQACQIGFFNKKITSQPLKAVTTQPVRKWFLLLVVE